ncbi:MAG: galactokinase [Pelagibacterales bacterium]|nr:galactokinase [Pelagibacterales bacterium]
MKGFISPLRISFVGGGSDMPFYYKKYRGEVITSAINKYTWVLINKLQNKNLLLKYSKSELVDSKKKIKHRLIKEIMKNYNFRGLDINFIADLPNRAGLGSSSSFTVALIGALEKFKGKKINKKKLAKAACDIEIKKLKDPIGKQDQYISAFGGLCHIIFKKNNVFVKKINIEKRKILNFEKSISLINTGIFRSANKILKKQSKKAKKNEHIYHEIRNLVPQFLLALKNNDIKKCGNILKENWNLKKKLDDNVYLKKFTFIEKKLNKLGVYGYKLLGAGSGGYYCVISSQDQKKKLKKIFKKKFLSIKFDNLGAREVKISI